MNTVILAAAGGRKTQYVIDSSTKGCPGRRLIVTFAQTGQSVLKARLWQAAGTSSPPEVAGWYGFLINEIVKPYLPAIYPEARVRSLHFVSGGDPARYESGVHRYIDAEGDVYSHRLSKFSFDILKASKGAALDRLERIYSEIYIDEVQDLTGNDLDILEALLRSSISVTLVGDVRQSILTTSRTDTKHRASSGLKKIDWFRRMESKGLCSIEYISETWRCRQEVIDLADEVLGSSLGLPKTTSHFQEASGHDGVFIVHRSNAGRYVATYSPVILRHSVTTRVTEGAEVLNFGQAKGITRDRVLIYPTKPIAEWLRNGKALTDDAACRLYVAITRARFSVCFVIDGASEYQFPEWIPDAIL